MKNERLSITAAPSTTKFGIAGLKTAMTLMGFFGGETRLPLLFLKEEEKAALASTFQAAGVFEAAQCP